MAKMISIKEVKLSKEGLNAFDLRDEAMKYFNHALEDTVRIYGHPYLLSLFICYLGDLNPRLGRFVKDFSERYAYSKYHGLCPLPDESYIILDRKFAERINLKSYFKWIDKGRGDAIADITFNDEELRKIAEL